MRYFLLLFTLFGIVLAQPYAHAQGLKFFSNIQDVPIMSELHELEDRALIFDKPEGRIIESVALLSGASQEKVLNFYQVTLPQLGWGIVTEQRFFRDGEFLDLSFGVIEGQGVLRIMIRPSL